MDNNKVVNIHNIVNGVFCGDALAVLKTLPSGSVQMCCTSPPYWGLRDYGTAKWDGGDAECKHRVGGQVEDSKAPGAITTGQRPGVDASVCRNCGARRIDNQIGLEKTPEEYVGKLVKVFREVKRVLRDDGVLWLNLGDSYNGSGGAGGDYSPGGLKEGQPKYPGRKIQTLKPKDLVGIPWRVAFALQADGWWLRSDIIWSKPNPMPESVRDRPTKAHEYIFFLTKSARYYYDADAVKNPPSAALLKQIQDGYDGNGRKDYESVGVQNPSSTKARIIEGKRRKTDKQRGHSRRHAGFNDRWDQMTKEEQAALGSNMRSVWNIATKPYPGAHFATFPEEIPERCIKAGSKPGDIVLDPFGGSGTTGRVAKRLNREYILIELNPTYSEDLIKPGLAKINPLFD